MTTMTSALSEARQRLVVAIEAVRTAAADHERILRPKHRAHELIRRADGIAALAAARRASEDEALARWLIDECGPRPEPTLELIRAEHAAVAAERDRRAAEAAITLCEKQSNAAAALTSEAVETRDTAVFAVLAEEVSRIGAELAKRFAAALKIDAELAALAQALVAVSNAREVTSTVSGGALMAVDMIAEVRHAARDQSAQGDPAGARAFLDRLRGDAAARFEVS